MSSKLLLVLLVLGLVAVAVTSAQEEEEVSKYPSLLAAPESRLNIAHILKLGEKLRRY